MTAPSSPGRAPLQSSTLTIESLIAVVAVLAAVVLTVVGVGTSDEATTPVTTGNETVLADPLTTTDTAPPTNTEPPSNDPAAGLAPVAPSAVATPPAAAPTPSPQPPPAPSPTVIPPTTIPPTTVPPTPVPPAPTTTPRPTVLPTAGPGVFEPSTVAAGPVAVPVGGVTTFWLPEPKPVLHLPGHVLIYVDERGLSEVDIFEPYANDAGEPLADFAAVLAHFEADPSFAGMEPQAPLVIGGRPAQEYAGTAVERNRGFMTAPENDIHPDAGWIVPGRLRIWFIDAPGGVVAITAEAYFEDQAEFKPAVRLATTLIESMTFGD